MNPTVPPSYTGPSQRRRSDTLAALSGPRAAEERAGGARSGSAGHPSSASPAPRPRVRGKFLEAGGEKLYVRGVTYGTFRPGSDGDGLPYPDPEVVRRDFRAMAAAGANAVRTYTVPPRWLLDAAWEHGLRVMVGLPWEQHVTGFLDRSREIEARVREGVRSCAGHPAVLCYSVGNEIPASIVRWHGRRKVEAFVKRLYDAAKGEDPEGLVTYVNFPTTEFLELPFLDLFSFNVYLESREPLEAYLARLHNLAEDRPVLMAEIGLDSLRNGEEAQARILDWQVRTAFGAGCAGTFVFAWTDEWWRGGHEIEDWEFGLVTREREPKAALAAVREAYAEVPFPEAPEGGWPPISVVVCTHNGAPTIAETLRHLTDLRYPDYEVIVVDDGSTDESRRVIQSFDVRLISTVNRGLSAARNTGWRAASGEIVAYIDDDAYPDPHWLQYLAHAFREKDYAGVGGPNVVPPEDPAVAHAVANSPGGPVHVLLSDREAEHIPGCNMAFRVEWLERIGGFDRRYRAAGDDVDLCWRIQQAGGTLGFHPSALVWHHRRPSLRRYWKQQVGYGKAESLLEEKWPEKYNAFGHYAWGGRLYGGGLTRALRFLPNRVYHGPWGTAPFQSLYERGPGTWLSLPLMPEWYLGVGLLAGLVALGAFWPLLLWGLPLLALAIAAPAGQAVLGAARAPVPACCRETFLQRAGFRAVTALLHIFQPVARLRGRLKHGLTPWRKRGVSGWTLPWRRERTVWSEGWRAQEGWIRSVERKLLERGTPVLHGGAFDRWELEVRGGILGRARILTAVEEHGGGRQLVRFRCWPVLKPRGVVLAVLAGLLAGGAALAGAWVPAAVLGVGALWFGGLTVHEAATAQATLLGALEKLQEEVEAENEGIGAERVDTGGEAPDPATADDRAESAAGKSGTEARAGAELEPEDDVETEAETTGAGRG